jgi:peptidoglycan/xylan/chitin deacetylase (PgdA/CDA1 family)
MISLRRVAKLAVAALVHGARAEKLVGSRRLPFIVTYHRVIADGRRPPPGSHPAMLLSVRTLERHLDWLAKSFDLVSLDDVADRIGGSVRGRRPAAAVTFDDGYQDVCDNALPLLKRKGIPAAIFVVSDRVGTQELHMHDRLLVLVARQYEDWPAGRGRLAMTLHRLGVDADTVARALAPGRRPELATEILLALLDGATLLRLAQQLEADPESASASARDHALADWTALREAAKDGFTIGSHGCSHALLANEDPRVVVHEVLGSRLEIERRLGIPVKHIAYPSGSFDPIAVRIVAAAGYRCGFTVCRHRDREFPELTIPRHVFWENTCRTPGGDFSGSLMACHVHDVPGFRPSCRGHARPAHAAAFAPPDLSRVSRVPLVHSEPGQ